MGVSGLSEYVPVQAARLSNDVVGTHVDCFGVKAVRSRPAAANNGAQSGATSPAGPGSICPGTTCRYVSRAAGSRCIEIMPDTSRFAGSESEIHPKLPAEEGARVLGL